MTTQQIKSFLLSAAIASVSMSGALAHADDSPDKTCASAASLFKDGDIPGALEEARWCVTQLEQIKQKQVAAYFKDEINGYKGEKLKKQQAMGMSMIERRYKKEGTSINVTLTGAASGAPSNAFSALSALGMQMGGMGQQVRIQRHTAMVMNESGKVSIIITLKSGGMLNFESRNVAFAKNFPVAKLDNARN